MSGLAGVDLSESYVPDPVVPRYELSAWRDEFGVVAGVTGRERSFALRPSGGDQQPDASEWQPFQHLMSHRFPGLVVSVQQHGTALATYREPIAGLRIERGLDGHMTQQTGLLLTVTLADCIPVYLVHPSTGTIALLHAGWRGTAAGILEHGVEHMCQLAGAKPAELVMHCGVGICGVCYEVGSEVFSAVTGTEADDHPLLDLRRNLVRRAERVDVGRVSHSAWCTAHDCERFHSYRRSGATAGRMIGYLGRPLA